MQIPEKYSLVGMTDDGIEVYETSEEIKSQPYSERKKIFKRLMEKTYRGRTAKFEHNGEVYYATFEKPDIQKNIYGDKRSDSLGRRAKINVGADGNIFELVENSLYNGNEKETGKTIKSHQNIEEWDYFIKTVKIDGKFFDVIANVRKGHGNAYVYSIQLNEQKKTKASPLLEEKNSSLNRVPNASVNTISQSEDNVNTHDMQISEKYSPETKHHISETFSDEIDAALNGSMSPHSQVRARDYTPSVLVENGVKNLPMLITQKHVKSIVYTEDEAKRLGLDMSSKNHYHGLGKELLMRVIGSMDDPLEIYHQGNNDYLVITEFHDNNGENIVIPVKIDGKGTYNGVYIDENQILSVYGRRNLERYLSQNNFKCIYKKGTALNPGRQLPGISSSLTERFPASVNTISQSEDNVNTYDMQIPEKYSLDAMDKTEELLEQYGALPEGERAGSAAGREVKVPRRTSKDNKTRRTVRTVMEAAVTSDEIAGNLKEKIENGEFSYLPT